MIASDHPADRPRPLALALFIALLVSVTEVVARAIGARESFNLQQLALAIAAAVALLGATAMMVAMIGLLVLRPFSMNGTLRSFIIGAAVTAVLVAVADFIRFPGPLSAVGHAGTLVATALILPAAVGRFARNRLVRYSVGLAWLAAAGTTTAAGAKTYLYVRPWAASVPTCQTRIEQPNILVLVLDTLRWDRVGVYSGSKLTPNLDRLAESAIVYTEAMSTAPWTLPMHASLFTGLYPQDHGISWGRYELDDRHPVLAELLKARGYHTFGVSSNWLLRKENGFTRGFDSFMEIPNAPTLTGWRLALRCEPIARAARWLGLPRGLGDDAGSAWTNWVVDRHLRAPGSTGPFFGFINYFEPHDPYLPPEPFATSLLSPSQREAYRRLRQDQEDLCAHACGLSGTFTDEQIKLMAALYDAEVAYQDAVVGELVEALQKFNLLDTTWLVVTSDHGELFGESNMVFHTAGSHYQLLHIPLLVRPPGGVEGRVVHAPVQPVDIFHSLASIGGATLPAQVQRSHPLPLSDDAPSHRTLCVSQTFGASITGMFFTQYRSMQADVSRWLHWITSVYADGFLLDLDERGPQSLYDVRQDPNMTRDLKEQRPEIIDRLLGQYRSWLAGAQTGGAI